jgi:hypothetical protein
MEILGCMNLMGRLASKSIFLSLCFLLTVSSVTSADYSKIGVAWPQGVSFDYAWEQVDETFIPNFELGVASMVLYSEIPLRVGIRIPVFKNSSFSYGIQGTAIAMWTELRNGDGRYIGWDYCKSHCEVAWGWGYWIGGYYRRFAIRGGVQRVSYYVPVGDSRYKQIFDHVWLGMAWSWNVQD